MFGLDSGAQIGLEYRFGIIKNGQIGLHRTKRQDDSVLRAVRPVEAGPPAAGRRVGDRQHRRHQQLQGQLQPVGRRHRLAPVRHRRRAVCRADLGQQHQRAAEGARRPQRHLHDRRRRPPARQADGVCRRRDLAARGRLQTGKIAGRVRDREARRRTHLPVELLERARHDERARWRAARSATTTGTWASTSRASSSEPLTASTAGSGNLQYHEAAGSLDRSLSPAARACREAVRSEAVRSASTLRACEEVGVTRRLARRRDAC